MTLILSKADVADLLDLPQAIACVEASFQEQGRGNVTPWPPSMMRTDGSHLIMRSGGLTELQRFGVRITAGPRGYDFAALFDGPSKELISFMAYPFSELRLAAATAVGVRALGPTSARRVAMLGTGRNAHGVLRAVAHVCHPESVRVYSPTQEHRVEFAREAGKALDLEVSASPDARTAVDGADIVLVCTSSQTPAVHGEWLDGSALVAAMGNRPEVSEDVFARAKLIVTTSRQQEMNVHEITDDWPLVQATRNGSVNWDDVVELGDVLAGRASRPPGICVFREAQGGFSDVALATWLHQRALELGRGVEMAIA